MKKWSNCSLHENSKISERLLYHSSADARTKDRTRRDSLSNLNRFIPLKVFWPGWIKYRQRNCGGKNHPQFSLHELFWWQYKRVRIDILFPSPQTSTPLPKMSTESEIKKPTDIEKSGVQFTPIEEIPQVSFNRFFHNRILNNVWPFPPLFTLLRS